jgi:hypothetical protein
MAADIAQARRGVKPDAPFQRCPRRGASRARPLAKPTEGRRDRNGPQARKRDRALALVRGTDDPGGAEDK